MHRFYFLIYEVRSMFHGRRWKNLLGSNTSKNRVFVKCCWWPRKLHFRNGVEFFCSRRFLLCFFKLVQLRINTACVSADVDSCMNSFRWFAKLERAATSVARSTTLRINGGCRATLDGNEGGNDRFSCVGIVSFYSIAKIFCEYKKWCWKIIINTI